MTEPRTETQALEQRITDALVTIRRDHPLLLPTRPSGARLGNKGKAALIKHADSDERGDDIDALTRRIDASHHVTVMVNGWVRLAAEDFSITETLPDGFDVVAMCSFLERWAQRCSWHAAAEDMAGELEGLVASIREFVPDLVRLEDYRPQPTRRLIGRCTEEIEHEDGAIRPCAGRVFAYPDGDGTDTDDHDVDDPWAICERCGSKAVVSVWQKWMFPEVAEQSSDAVEKMRDRVLSVEEVLNLAHREFGKPAKRQALWHWVSRGQLEPIDRDRKPHTFRLGDVVDFLAAKVG